MKKALFVSLALLCFTSALKAQSLKKYNWENDLHQRYYYDFTKTHDEVKDYIRQYIPNVTDKQMAEWEARKLLESMVLDGKKLYFKNTAANLFRVDPECKTIKDKIQKPQLSGSEKANSENVPAIIAEAFGNAQHLAQPKTMKVTYTVTVKADAVPAGKVVRCWLPFPRTDVDRQQNVKLISTSQVDYKFAKKGSAHSTLYMEKIAEAGKSTVFSETFEYTSNGQYFGLNESMIKPYNKKSKLYKEYTAEREKHIVFTPRMRQLADSLTRGLTTPLQKARALFLWLDSMFPWASAREYSTLSNIPEYVLANGHGDCGQVSLLFITLCRICGIPAHFQSGFMMHPGAWNLHDWAEIYFEGVGWVPVDQSFGVPPFAKNEAERLFFLGGIDSWRMVVNQDYGKDLSPKKTYPRSETVDFQRGEVEWEGDNLYFNDWTYKMLIDYENR